MTDKTTKERKKERADERYRGQFHSTSRVLFFKDLPCEVTGRKHYYLVENAHTRGDGTARRGPYESIVPLMHLVHFDFDVLSEAKFEEKYRRTKQSIRDRATHYQRLWLEHSEGE